MLKTAQPKDLSDIVNLIKPSLLGEMYFKNKSFSVIIEKAIEREEIILTFNNEETTGLLWVELNGTFGKYPYLHMLLVKESHQGKGIGKLLLKYFEEDLTSEYHKVFLMVADQNEKAKAIYLKSGYKQVGILEDFYANGITEILMRKDK